MSWVTLWGHSDRRKPPPPLLWQVREWPKSLVWLAIIGMSDTSLHVSSWLIQTYECDTWLVWVTHHYYDKSASRSCEWMSHEWVTNSHDQLSVSSWLIPMTSQRVGQRVGHVSSWLIQTYEWLGYDTRHMNVYIHMEFVTHSDIWMTRIWYHTYECIHSYGVRDSFRHMNDSDIWMTRIWYQTYECIHSYGVRDSFRHLNDSDMIPGIDMGWLRLVGSLKL